MTRKGDSFGSSGNAPIVAGVGMPGDAGVGSRSRRQPNGPVVLLDPSINPRKLKTVWRGYAVLAVPSDKERPKLEATPGVSKHLDVDSKRTAGNQPPPTRTEAALEEIRDALRDESPTEPVATPPRVRRVPVSSSQAGKGWDVLARVFVEVDPAKPGIAHWTRKPDTTADMEGLADLVEDAKDGYKLWSGIAELGPYLHGGYLPTLANRLATLMLAGHPRELQMALALDDVGDRLIFAIGVLGRQIAKDHSYDNRDRVCFLPFTSEVRDRVNRLIARINEVGSENAESEVKQLGMIADIPGWGEPAYPPTITVRQAKKIADDGLWGMERPKEELINLLVDWIHWGNVMAETGNPWLPAPPLPVIAFIGPPGTGKTELASAAARMMGRKFIEIPAGAINDVALLKGDDSTNQGNKAGRIIDALIEASTTNSLLLIDEIDNIEQLAVFYSLLELFDPTQRSRWKDNLLANIPVDCSNLQIAVTAKVKDAIPSFLADRVSVVDCGGYSTDEKVLLAQSKLIPRVRTEHYLTPAQFSISEPALRTVIRNYTYREAGVWILKEQIAALARNIERELSVGNIPHSIAESDVTTMLHDVPVRMVDPPPNGPPGSFRALVVYAETGSGGVIGAQVTVEPARPFRAGVVKHTGMQGQMTTESDDRARSLLLALGPKIWKERFGLEFPKDLLLDSILHFSADEWEVDGPSAGWMTFVAAISAITGIPMRPDVVGTGTINMRGHIGAVGGVDAKLLGAYELDVRPKFVLIPKENVGYLDLVAKHIINPRSGGMHVIPVDNVDDVLDIFFSPEIVMKYRGVLDQSAREWAALAHPYVLEGGLASVS